MTQTVDEVNAAAHPNAREARAITDQIATCPFDGGPGANVYFALSEERAVAVNAWIDPETGGLVVDVERLSFAGEIELRIDSETVTSGNDTSR